MFSNLLNLEIKRNLKQAIGFYIAYLIFVLLLITVVGFVTDPSRSFEAGVEFGQRFVVLIAITLSFLIFYKKNSVQSFKSIAIILLVAVCAIFGGALLAMIPISYITTLDDNN